MLTKLRVENQEKLLSFLVLFSRFEYALKRSGYYNKCKKSAEADWLSFIKDIKKSFKYDKTEDIKLSTDYLINYPAKEQIIKNSILDFEIHKLSKEGGDINKIFNSIRITRNNLFHGGKFPLAPIADESRNLKLIDSCISMLEYFLTLNPTVENYFWEIE